MPGHECRVLANAFLRLAISRLLQRPHRQMARGSHEGTARRDERTDKAARCGTLFKLIDVKPERPNPRRDPPAPVHRASQSEKPKECGHRHSGSGGGAEAQWI